MTTLDKLLACSAFGISLGMALWLRDEMDLRAASARASEFAASAAAGRRQFHEASCIADGGRPIAGERLVYCERVRCEPGMAMRIWERSWR